MKIKGLQKMSLLDYPDQICATVFTSGCNYRCPFCHNASIITDISSQPGYSSDEVIAFLKRRIGRIDGVCITGGEPLLQAQLEPFIREIRALGFLIKLDTNGSFPQQLKQLIDKELVDYVAMDIKNAPEFYGKTIGVTAYDLEPVKESVALLLANNVAYEFRTTVVRQFHNADNMLAIAQWIKGAQHYYLQKFVDSSDVLVSGLSSYSKAEMDDFQALVRPLIPTVALRGM